MGKERRSEEETEACASDSLPLKLRLSSFFQLQHTVKNKKGGQKETAKNDIERQIIVKREGPKLAHHSINSRLQFPQEGARDKWGCRGRERGGGTAKSACTDGSSPSQQE